MFHGKPIIAYSIQAAHESGLFDHVYVSTEDSEIADVAMQYGGSLLPRPVELADSETGTQEVMAHGLAYLERLGLQPAHACCIYPCVPMLTAADLRVGLEIFCTPYRYVYVNGWFYWGDVGEFGENPSLEASFEMDRLIGDRWIDINSEEDWQRASQMYAARHA